MVGGLYHRPVYQPRGEPKELKAVAASLGRYTTNCRNAACSSGFVKGDPRGRVFRYSCTSGSIQKTRDTRLGAGRLYCGPRNDSLKWHIWRSPRLSTMNPCPHEAAYGTNIFGGRGFLFLGCYGGSKVTGK